MILPEPVTRKRFAVPRMSLHLRHCLRPSLLLLVSFFFLRRQLAGKRGDEHVHVAAFHLGLAFDDRYVLQVVGQALQDGQALFGWAISRPRNMMVILTLLPAERKRITCFFFVV